MTNEPQSDAARIADILTRYTNRTIIEMGPDGELVGRQPSLRSIERATDIAHQRISEFLKNPEGATPTMLQRMTKVVTSPDLITVYRGKDARVAYVDFPVYTSAVAAAIPSDASAFRIVSQTDDDKYKGFRSSEWLGDFDNMDTLADAMPGGRDIVQRIVADVGQ